LRYATCTETDFENIVAECYALQRKEVRELKQRKMTKKILMINVTSN